MSSISGPNGEIRGWISDDGIISGPNGQVEGWIGRDGTISGPNGEVKGWVSRDGTISGPNGEVKGWVSSNGNISGSSGEVKGWISGASTRVSSPSQAAPPQSSSSGASCGAMLALVLSLAALGAIWMSGAYVSYFLVQTWTSSKLLFYSIVGGVSLLVVLIIWLFVRSIKRRKAMQQKGVSVIMIVAIIAVGGFIGSMGQFIMYLLSRT